MEMILPMLSMTIAILGAVYYFHRDIKADIAIHTARLDAANARTDKLYEMFIDLLKEGRK